MFSRIPLLAAAAAFVVGLAMPAAASAAEGVATRAGTLRAGPGTDYPSVDHIESGDDLEIYGCLRGYSWCDVSTGDNRGWYQGSRIAFVRAGRRVYLPEVAPEFGIGILGFGATEYWDDHYRSRPFYNQRDRFERNDHQGGNPGQFRPNPPPVVQPNVQPNNLDRRREEERRQRDFNRQQPQQPRPPVNNNPPPIRNNPPPVHNNSPPQIHNNPPPVHNNPPPAPHNNPPPIVPNQPPPGSTGDGRPLH